MAKSVLQDTWNGLISLGARAEREFITSIGLLTGRKRPHPMSPAGGGGTGYTKSVAPLGAQFGSPPSQNSSASTTPRTAVTVRAGSSSYYGFDAWGYPGGTVLSWLYNAGFRIAGFYLNHKRGGPADISWKNNKANLKGWGLVPLYLGLQNGPPDHAVDAAKVDAAEAIALMTGAGFEKGSAIYFDIEDGTTPSGNYDIYLSTWFQAVRDGGFVPAVYCSHRINDWVKKKQIPCWSYNVRRKNGTYSRADLLLLASIDEGCVGTQYAQAVHFSDWPPEIENVFHLYGIDLSLFNLPDPSDGKSLGQPHKYINIPNS